MTVQVNLHRASWYEKMEVRNQMLVLGLVFQKTFAPTSLFLPSTVLQSGNQLVGLRAVSGTPSVGEWKWCVHVLCCKQLMESV